MLKIVVTIIPILLWIGVTSFISWKINNCNKILNNEERKKCRGNMIGWLILNILSFPAYMALFWGLFDFFLERFSTA